MGSFSYIPKEAIDYWQERLNTLQNEIQGIEIGNEGEYSGLAEALKASLTPELDMLSDKLSGLSDSGAQHVEKMSNEVFTTQAIVCSMEARARDYLMATSPAGGTPGTASGSAAPPPSPFKLFLNNLLAALTSISNWLLNLLKTATTLKGWKISGDLGNNVLGFASAKLEISFG
jgi:hypothetical protein